MNFSLEINEEILIEASELKGVKDESTLVRMGLESLVTKESARELAELGGTQPQLKPIRRRKPL